MDSEESNKNFPENPRENASFVSVLTHWWTLPFFIKGIKKENTEHNIFRPMREDSSSTLGKQLAREWNKEKQTNKNPSLFVALFRVFGLETLFYCIPFIINQVVLKLSQPMLLTKLLNSVENNSFSDDTYIYVTLFIAALFANSLITHWYSLNMQHLGMKIRIACSSVIYRKILKLQNAEKMGKIINLLSNDVTRFDKSVLHLHSVWFLPIEISLATYIMCQTVDALASIGIIVIILLVPFQIYLGIRNTKLRSKIALKTDKRMQLITEMITGIQIIKMYTWERYFTKLVKTARRLEMNEIRKSQYVKAIFLSLSLFSTRISIFIIILAGSFYNKTVDATYVFVATSFYNIIKQTTSRHFAQGISEIGDAKYSISRIQKFLLSDEINIKKRPRDSKSSPKIVIKHGLLSRFNKTRPILNNININIQKPQLVALTGPVGSGKSTLIKIILGELPLDEGNIEVVGRISYCSQEPWLFAGTIEENILFTETFNLEKYETIVELCALNNDFDNFLSGDKTLIGERGLTLSGGQKARINLARALYLDADIYILDDCLSSVNVNVGTQIFEQGIKSYLRDKFTIFVTHQKDHLQNIEKILKLENGKVLLCTHKPSGIHFDYSLNKTNSAARSIRSRRLSMQSRVSHYIPTYYKEVKRITYLTYFKYGKSNYILISVLLLFIVTQLIVSISDYFIAFWVNLQDDYTTFSKDACVMIYSILTVSLISITLLRSFGFFKYCANVSTTLHDNMFSSVIETCMQFFYTTSSGKILNRFSKAVDSLDELLPSILLDCLQIGLNVAGVTIIIAILKPWMIIVSVIILSIFYAFRQLYLYTSRDLKRLEASNRSPIFSQVITTLQGVVTVRAFNAQEKLIKMFDNHQDLHTSAWFMYISCATAFGFWLELICISYIAIVSFVISNHGENEGRIGLAVTQAASLTGLFQWGMRQWSELENQMTCVERIEEYINLKQEKDSNWAYFPSMWPTNGCITFQSVSLKYSSCETNVLHKLSFKIFPHEKIGIIGRTGSGKSSLINAIFRLVNIEGQILIDGSDIRSIPIYLLRKKISIIPQEGTMFSGTIRENIDPFNEFNDVDIWSALEDVQLKDFVLSLPLGLNQNVLNNFTLSAGQLQLFCLARVIVRRNKIVILDEATANLDYFTSKLIQNTIKYKFKECTLIIIAHHLHTILESDRIIVLKTGEIVEFDKPQALLKDKNSLFYNAVKDADIILK